PILPQTPPPTSSQVCPPAPVANRVAPVPVQIADPLAYQQRDRSSSSLSAESVGSSKSITRPDPTESDPAIEAELSTLLLDLDSTPLEPLSQSTPAHPASLDFLNYFRPSESSTAVPSTSRRYCHLYQFDSADKGEQVKQLLINSLDPDFESQGQPSPHPAADFEPSTLRFDESQIEFDVSHLSSFQPQNTTSSPVVPGRFIDSPILPTRADPTDRNLSEPSSFTPLPPPLLPVDTMAFSSAQLEQLKQIAAIMKADVPTTPTQSDYWKREALRPEVAGLFWPDYDGYGFGSAGGASSRNEPMVTNKDGTFYRNCGTWFETWPRLSEACGGYVKLAASLEHYIRGKCKFWFSFTLTEAERKAMRESLTEWKSKISERFATKASTAQASLATFTYTPRDIASGRAISSWFQQRFRCAQQTGITAIPDLLQN
ncbi:hypothetical protein BJ508DRAFT_337089, partial [Ascobolus immersus RN42]